MTTEDALQPVVSAHLSVLESLAAATTGRTRRGPGGTLLAVSGASIAEMNVVASPSLQPDPAEIASLAESETWDCPWCIQVRGEPGELVVEVAQRHGLNDFTRPPLMVREAAQGQPAGPVTGSLRVRPVPPGELGLYAGAIAEGFEAPREAFEFLTAPAVSRIDGVTFYIAEADGAPVGTGMTAVSGNLTGIFNIAVFPRRRRLGFGRAITAEMIRAGIAAGAPTAYLYSSMMGQTVYQSLGFSIKEHPTIIQAPA